METKGLSGSVFFLERLERLYKNVSIWFSAFESRNLLHLKVILNQITFKQMLELEGRCNIEKQVDFHSMESSIRFYFPQLQDQWQEILACRDEFNKVAIDHLKAHAHTIDRNFRAEFEHALMCLDRTVHQLTEFMVAEAHQIAAEMRPNAKVNTPSAVA